MWRQFWRYLCAFSKMRPSSSSSSYGSHSFTLSSVSVAVDKATSELLLTPDWTIILAICDCLNTNRWQSKDAIKAVKRRLQHKSSKVQLLTLTLLEAMMKNCGDFLHPHIADKHLLQDLVKIVRKKMVDFEVRNRILILVDTWNEAFGGVSCKHQQYNRAYQELKRFGVKFPQRSREAPLMLAPQSSSSASSSSSTNLMTIGSFKRLDETMATEIESLSLSSLESMRNVMNLVEDMVQAVDPSDKSAIKDELIVDLVEQCRSNQKKLIQMLTTTADEDIMARGLELNDSLQVVLARHDFIASGVSLPKLQGPETTEARSVLKTADIATVLEPESESESESSSSSESQKEREDIQNDFTQLTKRHSLLNAQLSDEEEETLLLGNNNEITTETEAKTVCKDIALLDTTTTTTATTKSEQDIIELLSLTLSTTALPSPQTETQTQTQTQPPSYITNDNIIMNSYVVPWAQSQAEPQVSKMAQFAPSGPQYQPWPLQQQQQISYGYPQPQWSGGQVSSNGPTLWSQGGNNNKVFDRNLQYSNSVPAKAAGPSGAVAAVDGQAHMPYVPPYKLFEDLNAFWNADGGVRSTK